MFRPSVGVHKAIALVFVCADSKCFPVAREESENFYFIKTVALHERFIAAWIGDVLNVNVLSSMCVS